jgi:HK97 family phage major capsid protein
MPLYTTTGAGILAPEEISDLIVRPVAQASVAYQVSTPVIIEGHSYRIPIVAADPSAGWTPEGSEINVTDPTITELEIVPPKVAGLTVISRELALDTSPAATEVVGQGLARDIAKRVEQAFFKTAPGTTTNGPNGLGSLTGVQEVIVGDMPTDLDPFAEAISKAENEGAALTAFCMHPDTALALAQLKQDATSNMPLLQPAPDPTAPTSRQVLGVPVYVSPVVDETEIWGIPQQFSFVVQNKEATLDVDSSAYFSSDRIGIRATLRVAFGWPHEASIVRIDVSEGS